MVIKVLIKYLLMHPHVSNSYRPFTVLFIRPRENYSLLNPFGSIHSSSYACLCCLLYAISTMPDCRNIQVKKEKIIQAKTDLNSYPSPVSIVYETGNLSKCIQEIFCRPIEWLCHSLWLFHSLHHSERIN